MCDRYWKLVSKINQTILVMKSVSLYFQRQTSYKSNDICEAIYLRMPPIFRDRVCLKFAISPAICIQFVAICFVWIHVIYAPIFLRISSFALTQSYGSLVRAIHGELIFTLFQIYIFTRLFRITTPCWVALYRVYSAIHTPIVIYCQPVGLRILGYAFNNNNNNFTCYLRVNYYRA